MQYVHTFRRSEVSFGIYDDKAREHGCKYRLDFFTNGDDKTYVITVQPTLDGRDFLKPFEVPCSSNNSDVAILEMEAAMEKYRESCGPARPIKTFAFGITDTYGRECGCSYQLGSGKHWQTGEVYHHVTFLALRDGRHYQASKCASAPTAEAAAAHAEKMVENYRKRCAKQFAPKVADAEAA
jgi:hypothetical protein